jgi:hypothetical protein
MSWYSVVTSLGGKVEDSGATVVVYAPDVVVSLLAKVVASPSLGNRVVVWSRMSVV